MNNNKVQPNSPRTSPNFDSTCCDDCITKGVIIMAQQQHAADVDPDELCPPNKRYDLMDANKKVELKHVQCPSESKILMKIIKNHPLRFSIAASTFVPWIYMAQFWNTLKEDRSKNRLKFLLDRKELTLTLDDFRTIFHLPQTNDNNHASFVPPPSFSDMVPFYKQVLGFTMELKTVSNFKISGLLQPWQTLCKIFSKCLTTRVTGWDQPPLQIMQMLYCFVNNIHVDYAELMWEGIYYSLHHPATSIPYLRFTKIIISHYMNIFPDISRRARDAYHNLQDDDIMKNIFNSGRNKNKVGMRIPAWMITDEMKLTEHYKMYAEVFGLDVPLTQSQPTESTQGTHRTPSAPRSPNPATEIAESMPSAEKADEMILQDMIQVSLAEHKSREEQEARENVALVYEHLAAEEIEKLVEDPENVDDSSPPRHDDTSIPGTRLEPRSDKESPEVEIVQEKEEETTKDTEVEPDKDTPMVDVTNIVRPVNVDDEEDEITDEVFELRRRVKGKNVEENSISPIPSPTRSPRILYSWIFGYEKLQGIEAKPIQFKDTRVLSELQGRYGYLFAHLKKRFMPRTSSDQLADNLHDVLMETLPSLVKEKVRSKLRRKFLRNYLARMWVYTGTDIITYSNAIDNAILSLVDASADPLLQQQDIAIWLALQMKFEKTQNSAKKEGRRHRILSICIWRVIGMIPTKQVTQDIMEEISLKIDEAKLKKMADEMLRQRYPEAPALSLINQDLLYLKKGNSGPENIVLSLHKFPAIVFNDDDIEQRTSRWVNKCIKKFNLMQRDGVKNWKNPMRRSSTYWRQKDPGRSRRKRSIQTLR
ncbi:hypothetical protein Tco_0771584 [Tanacetum coccineum]|uniref:Uncharacterized protein n=1 Tax=Tanacetum coccineum TaxID=301880 RepID=A0ABQ4ZFE7_9ASTR